MIVTLKKTGMSNREHVDPTFPVLVKQNLGDKLIAISGKQLLIAGLKETVVGAPILPHKNYITGVSSVEEVRYVTFNRDIMPDGQRVKMSVRMQYLGVDEQGYVMVRPTEVINAGMQDWLVWLFVQPHTGYAHLNMRYLRFD